MKKESLVLAFFLFAAVFSAIAGSCSASSLSTSYADSRPTIYVMIGITVFMLAMLVVAGVYVIINQGRVGRMTGVQKQVKQLENKVGASMIGVLIGGILIISFYVIGDTPAYFWADTLPRPLFDYYSSVFNGDPMLAATVLVGMILIGLGLLFGMLTVMAYYSRKLKKLKTANNQQTIA